MEQIKYVGPGGMVVEEMGTGPRVLFVHGGGAGGALAWKAQWPMATDWRLVMPARPGYGESPWLGSEDFERDTDYIAALAERLGGKRVVIHGGGHTPQTTSEQFNSALGDFLAGSAIASQEVAHGKSRV